MTTKEIKEAYEIIAKLESGRVVNSQDFARILTVATGQPVKPTRCIPCIKADLKRLKAVLANINSVVEPIINNDNIITEEKIIDPTPIKIEKEVNIKSVLKKDIKDVQKKSKK